MRSQIVPVCVFVHAWAVQRQLKANSGILSGSKWDAAGCRWQQPRCVFRLFMWNHLKANKRSLPPSPVPLFLSASHSTKERNEWMKEQQRKGYEVRGWGCKGEAGWGSGARWVLVSGQNRGGGIFSPLCYGTIVGLGTWLVMALHYKPVGALHLRVEVYVDVHFSETPSEWFLIQSLYLKDFSGTAHKSLPPCVSSKSSCVVIQINSRLHQFKVWQSKCVLTFQQWEWFLEF